MKITFHGGAQSVTGANYLIETGSKKVIVDCGLAQGSKFAERLNYEQFPYNPAEIDAVCITHSHADHCGRLPKLVKDGFNGPIYATEPTSAIIEVTLADNMSLLAEEAQEASHAPLYNEQDLQKTISLVKPQSYYKTIRLEDVEIRFHNAGHILGSSILDVNAEGNKLYFSGDLGNPPTPLLPDPDSVNDADYIVLESAYGDRVHEDRAEREEIFKRVIKDTINSKGVLIIPSFAIERAQELLYAINQMVNKGDIPQVPVYFDSPLAIKLTGVYKRFKNYFNMETLKVLESDDDIFSFPGLTFTTTPEDSKSINNIPPPKIIIAGSGMSTGGRILHHERRYLPDPNSTILFVGYQTEGSLGREIFEGATEVMIFGETIPVRCRVEAIGGYSAHADKNQLLEWVSKSKDRLKKVFVVQGETQASQALADYIKAKTGIESIVPEKGNSFDI